MGWTFEMLFFSVLNHRSDGVRLFDAEGKSHNWPKGTPTLFDPLNVAEKMNTLKRGGWIQPKKWNQGGYDAVLITKNEGTKTHEVTFVQVASGVEHDLKLYYMHALLRRLQSFLSIGKVEVVFVVPRGNIHQFKIGNLTGTLVRYGWKKGEEKGKCKIWALDEVWPYTDV